MVAIRAYLVDLKYVIEETILVSLYCRTPEGKIVVIKDSFRPNFFILPKKDIDVTALRAKIGRLRIDDNNYVISTNISKLILNCQEESFIQVFLSRPEAMRGIRNIIRNWPEIINFFEDDISLTRRYLLENKIVPYSVFEAEVTEEDDYYKLVKFTNKDISFIEPKLMSITAIYDFDRHGQKAISSICCSSAKTTVITWKHLQQKNEILTVKSEEELLNAFKQLILREKPDIILFEDTSFRLKDIMIRAKKYNISMNICIDHTEPYISPINSRIRTIGINEVFITRIITNFIDMSLADKNLENAYQNITGIVNIVGLLENNDVINMIYRKAKINHLLFSSLFNNLTELFKLVGLRAADVLNFSLSSVIEWSLIKQCIQNRHIVLNRHAYDFKNEALLRYHPVIDPVPGIYDNVAIIDLSSVYPQLIIAEQISPDTISCDLENVKGVLPIIIEDMVSRIDRINIALSKTQNDNLIRRKLILLRITNYFYEYLNNQYSRWYSKELLEKINSAAKNKIHELIGVINSINKVVFSDYHELFIELKEPENDLLLRLHRISSITSKLECKDIAKKILFLPRDDKFHKKRYAYINSENKIVTQNIIKNSYPIYINEILTKVINMVLTDSPKNEIIIELHSMILDLLKHKISNEKLLINSKLTKDIRLYHERTIQFHLINHLKKQNINVVKGDRISYIVAEMDEPISKRSFLLNEMDNKKYDPDYYIEKLLLPILEDLLRLKGISIQEVEQASSQMQLSKFLK
ncbi:MAG: DNA polymerase domain-containing protein [Candidatus Woesearchaeota archaeon]